MRYWLYPLTFLAGVTVALVGFASLTFATSPLRDAIAAVARIAHTISNGGF